MRSTLFLLTLLLPFKAWANCPELRYVVASIHEIRQSLASDSDTVILIKDMKFKPRLKDSNQAVSDLLAGNFQGYIIERLKETIPGECHYRLRDDRSTINGVFILQQQ